MAIRDQNSKLQELVSKSNVGAVNKANAERDQARRDAAEMVEQIKRKCYHDTYEAEKREREATERAKKAEDDLKRKTFLAFGLLAFTLLCEGVMNAQVRADFIDFFKVPVIGIFNVASNYIDWLIGLSDKLEIGWAWIIRILLTLLIGAGLFGCGFGIFVLIKKYNERWCTLSLKVIVISLAIITVFGKTISSLLPINLILLFFLIQVGYICALWYFDGYFENRYRTDEWKQIQNR